MNYSWRDLELDLEYPQSYGNDTVSYLTKYDKNWRACVKPDFFVIIDPDNGGIQVSGKCDSIDEGKELVRVILKIQHNIII